MDENGKNAHIFASMKSVAPRIQLCQTKRHRTITFMYFVTVGCSSVRVCKKAFTQLHAVSASKVRFIGEQLASGCAAPRPTVRGTHSTRYNRCLEQLVSGVKEISECFPQRTLITHEHAILIEITYIQN